MIAVAESLVGTSLALPTHHRIKMNIPGRTVCYILPAIVCHPHQLEATEGLETLTRTGPQNDNKCPVVLPCTRCSICHLYEHLMLVQPYPQQSPVANRLTRYETTQQPM